MTTTTTRARSKLFSEKEEVQRSPASSSSMREECSLSVLFRLEGFWATNFLGFHKCASLNPKLVVSRVCTQKKREKRLDSHICTLSVLQKT